MARGVSRLSAIAVSRAKEPGRYADGGGLWLQVGPTGGKSWVLRFMLNGRAREMGLGPLHTVSLAEARTEALRCRKLLLSGIDPIEARNGDLAQARLESKRGMTFVQCADAFIAAHEAGWKSAKHAAQWRATLATYAYPVFGDLPVRSVDLPLVMKVLEPIWQAKTETASRLRGRIESILDWATVRGYRTGDNPARWKGHLDKLLSPRSKV
ncbi:MAG: Arm DNA-binding domain-containing protein, partial [Alphaproteobacteria bacterium]